MSNPSSSCFVCDGRDFKKLFIKKGHHFWGCPQCGLQKQDPLPTPEELSAYYEQSYNSGMYEEFASASSLKDMTAQQRLKEVGSVIPLEGRWLDVGASTGNFSYAASQQGIDAEGVELSETACQSGRERGITMHAGMLNSLPEVENYDCITAFDLIEHVLDPPQLIHDAYKRLKSGGYLVLTLPDLGSLQRMLMRSRWYFYIPEEHLHYFKRSTMRRFLERQDFEIVKIKSTYKPMTFDYAQTQFQEYNPLIYNLLRLPGAVLPKSLRNYRVPLPIGEMCAIAQKRTQ